MYTLPGTLCSRQLYQCGIGSQTVRDSQGTDTMTGRKKLKVWRYYQEVPGDYTKVICTVEGCVKEISRGKTGAKRSQCNSTNMLKHTMAKHPEEWKIVQEAEAEAANEIKAKDERERKKNETEKGGNHLWHLNSKVARWNFFKRVSNHSSNTCNW